MSQVGVTMGLSVMLDAHTDLVETYTVDSDFNSFLGVYLFLTMCTLKNSCFISFNAFLKILDHFIE